MKFGLLKEQIFTALEKKYLEDKKLFKEDVNKIVSVLLKSETLNELFQQYNKLLTSNFEDENFAKDYVSETVSYLKSLNISEEDIKLLENLDKTEAEPNKYVLALDVLVFGNKKNIQERVEAKSLLVSKLITENSQPMTLDPKLNGVFLNILKKKLEAKLDNLTENEIKTLSAFANNDEEAILSNYIHLIDDNVSTVNEQIEEIGEDAPEMGKLTKVKDTLLEMKNTTKPTLNDVERLIVLKDGFK